VTTYLVNLGIRNGQGTNNNPGEPVPEKHSLLCILYNIFNSLSPFLTVCGIFLAYMSRLTVFFYNLFASFLWPACQGNIREMQYHQEKVTTRKAFIQGFINRCYTVPSVIL